MIPTITLTIFLTKAHAETPTLTRNSTNFLIRSYHVITWSIQLYANMSWGDSESASKNALIEVIFQLSGALLEKSRRSTVECLSTFVQNQIVCSSISVWKYIEWSHFHKLHRACSEDCLKIWAGWLSGSDRSDVQLKRMVVPEKPDFVVFKKQYN